MLLTDDPHLAPGLLGFRVEVTVWTAVTAYAIVFNVPKFRGFEIWECGLTRDVSEEVIWQMFPAASDFYLEVVLGGFRRFGRRWLHSGCVYHVWGSEPT